MRSRKALAARKIEQKVLERVSKVQRGTTDVYRCITFSELYLLSRSYLQTLVRENRYGRESEKKSFTVLKDNRFKSIVAIVGIDRGYHKKPNSPITLGEVVATMIYINGSYRRSSWLSSDEFENFLSREDTLLDASNIFSLVTQSLLELGIQPLVSGRTLKSRLESLVGSKRNDERTSLSELIETLPVERNRQYSGEEVTGIWKRLALIVEVILSANSLQPKALHRDYHEEGFSVPNESLGLLKKVLVICLKEHKLAVIDIEGKAYIPLYSWLRLLHQKWVGWDSVENVLADTMNAERHYKERVWGLRVKIEAKQALGVIWQEENISEAVVDLPTALLLGWVAACENRRNNARIWLLPRTGKKRLQEVIRKLEK